MKRHRGLVLLVAAAWPAWNAAALPVGVTAVWLGLTLGPLLALSLRAPGVRVWRPPTLALIGLAMPIALIASPRPAVLAWPRITLLLWSIGAMAAIASIGVSSKRGRLAVEEPPVVRSRILLLLAAAALAAWTITAANERAGTLALAVPVVAGALLGTRRLRPGYALLVPAALWIGGSLVATGSRGGLVAAGCGLGAVLALRLPARARARVFVGLSALVAVVVFLVSKVPAVARALGHLIADGSPQGLSLELALHGRPAIWQRAWLMLEDVPLTGAGPGSFDPLIKTLYPLGFADDHTLEDAHQAVLQTWFDLGPVGVLAIALLVARALTVTWRTSRGGSPAAPLAAGLFGGLAAWLAFGLADTVAMGTPGNILFWLLLGATWTLPGLEVAGKTRWLGRPAVGVFLVVAALVAGAVLSPPARQGVFRTVARNRAALATFRARLGEGDRSTHQGAAVGTQVATCGGAWLAGQRAGWEGQADRQRAHWLGLVRCSTRHLPMLASAAPTDRALAEAAVDSHPTSAVAWRWAAGTLGRRPATGDRALAITRWRRALALDPRDGLAWRRLGDLLALDHQLRPAIDAYAASCTHGDPGANGCVLAGRLSLHLGDPDQAIAFYRRSRWRVAHAWADRLEAQPR